MIVLPQALWSQVRLPPLLVFRLTFGGIRKLSLEEDMMKQQPEITVKQKELPVRHDSLKNPFHVSLRHCELRAGEERGDSKPVFHADRT